MICKKIIIYKNFPKNPRFHCLMISMDNQKYKTIDRPTMLQKYHFQIAHLTKILSHEQTRN